MGNWRWRQSGSPVRKSRSAEAELWRGRRHRVAPSHVTTSAQGSLFRRGIQPARPRRPTAAWERKMRCVVGTGRSTGEEEASGGDVSGTGHRTGSVGSVMKGLEGRRGRGRMGHEQPRRTWRACLEGCGGRAWRPSVDVRRIGQPVKEHCR
jgi:hypothetical protein